MKIKHKELIFVGILLIAIALIAYVANRTPQNQPSKSSKEVFTAPKTTSNHVSNSPVNGAILAAPPVNIVIDFDTPLQTASMQIKNEENETDYGVDQTIIDENKLTMRRKMEIKSPNQTYTVSYNACWSNKKCGKGSFEFKIDRNQRINYTDFKNNFEAKILIKNNLLNPQHIKVKPGTKIVWINEDDTEHEIHSDPVKTHTYHPEISSESLKKTFGYTVVLYTPGEYFYHDSKNDSLTGSIVVE